MGQDGYSQDEVRAILKRAAQLEGEKRDEQAAVALSLDDLEAIATESGLDPHAVRAAARELAASQPESEAEALVPARRLSGTRLHHERLFDGELHESDLERLVDRAAERLRLPGRTTRQQRSWQWASRWGARRVRVRAASRREHTSISIEEDLSRLGLKLYGGLAAGVTLAGSALGFLFGLNVESSVAGALFMASLGAAASLAVGLGTAHSWFSRLRARRDVQLGRLTAELHELGRECLGAENHEALSDAEERESESDWDQESHLQHRESREDDDSGQRSRQRKRSR